MNPDDVCVQTLARTFDAFTGLSGMDEPDYKPSQTAVDLAMEQLFQLAKAGVKMVEPGDVVGEPVRDEEHGTVTLLLKAEA